MIDTPEAAPKKGKKAWIKVLVLLIVAATIAVVFLNFKDELTLESIAKQESALKEYQENHPVLVYGLAFLLYVAVAGLSLPAAAPLTLIYGWYFGFGPGLVVVSFASTVGATLAFLLSRHLLGESIQSKFGDRLSAFNRALEREGAFYLFTLRLIPVVPFFVINLVMGLTPIRVLTYFWVSQIGMLPGTAVYVYAGTAVPDLQTLSEQGAGGILTPKILLAFGILGLFPFLVKFVMKKVQSDPAG
jgi:uncharacterized membrane protein YdjX (TVP38/TMEM64 family)